ncbi:hypothetical protein EV363DRAFT_1178062 [Boletus edulis]|nr:hypothetical protein EV363DRAFT_1178062 [Boletus edulis]
MTGLQSKPEIPSHWELAYTDKLASHMVQQFRRATGLLADGESPIILANVGIETLCEADWMVNIMVRAYKNQIILENIDAIRLSERAQMESKFLPASDAIPTGTSPLQDIAEPAVIVDRSGGYSDMNNVDHLAHSLHAGLTAGAKGNWQTSEALYNMDADTKGVINMSPVWFQQARHGGTAIPEVSAAMRTESAQQWLSSIWDEAAIQSGALAIMHPEMYCSGLQTMVKLGEFAEEIGDTCMTAILAQWPSVYNVGSLMVNRASPFHVDRFGRPQWFDLLVTFGTYSDLYFLLPTLGLTLQYCPGTVIAMSGKMIEHGIGQTDGDRAVLA